jgi:hypothetical protein
VEKKIKPSTAQEPINQYELAKKIVMTIPFRFHNGEKIVVVKALLDTGAMSISLVRQGLFKSDCGLRKESVALKGIQS